MAGFNDAPIVQRLAIPAVILLIAFLGYTSQWLFHTANGLAPGPLTPRQSLVFNLLLASLWWTYFRACTVSPGRYVFPDVTDAADKAGPDAATATVTPDGALPHAASASASDDDDDDDDDDAAPKHPTSTSISLPPNADGTPRWCKKCVLPKPPRAHHCRHCGRCIPKMDHHCPWTANCVSLTTFPHFFRFLLYANISLWTLAYFLSVRFLALWDDRALPAYLGPSLPTLIHLTVLALLCGVTSLALGILLITTAKNWLFNTTSIEGWEIDRHEAQVDRGKHRGEDWWGVVDAQGRKFRLEPVEFPYDLGLFDNLAQAMGTRNPLAWFFPLSGNPRLGNGSGIGWDWEDNGLNDRPGMWPPPDPDKMRRAAAGGGWPGRDREDEYAVRYGEGPDARAAFRARQAADLERRRHRRESPDAEEEEEDSDASSGEYDYDMVDETYGRQGTDMDASRWANAYGERLGDYGVDEEAEGSDDGTESERPGKSVPVPAYDDEDVPLGELLRRRRVVELPDDYEE